MVYAPCFPRALGLETLSLEKVAFSMCSPGALGLEQEMAAYTPCYPRALGLETLLLEKVAFSSCSLGALRLHGFEWEEESLMDAHFEQASASLK
jgi:hypothetical protein